MKKCFKCKKIKPISDFYKHNKMKDGHLNKCKECSKFDVKKNRIENLDYYREYDKKRDKLDKRIEMKKKYSKSERGKISIKKSTDRYRNDNRNKYEAHIAVGNAVRDGILIKGDRCESCLSTNKRLHGHHDDYSKKLEVRWLCPMCHKKWHDDNGRGLNG